MIGIISPYFNRYEERKIPFLEGYIDKNGIPVFNALKFTHKEEYIYHPTVVIQYGLANFNLWKKNHNKAFFSSFKACAYWICSEAKWDSKNRFIQWSIPLEHNDLGHNAGWISALTQGQAISLLLRFLPHATQKDEILQLIKNALKSFYIELEDGGLTSTYPEGKFLQESGNIRILNGCLTAFTGLIEYLEVFPDDYEALALSVSVESSITKFLPSYDLGFWSLYSLGFRFNIADLHYHKTHIDQLAFFGNYLKNETFSYYAAKWSANLTSRKDIFLWNVARFFGLNFNRSLKVLGLGKFRFK